MTDSISVSPPVSPKITEEHIKIAAHWLALMEQAGAIRRKAVATDAELTSLDGEIGHHREILSLLKSLESGEAVIVKRKEIMRALGKAVAIVGTRPDDHVIWNELDDLMAGWLSTTESSK